MSLPNALEYQGKCPTSIVPVCDRTKTYVTKRLPQLYTCHIWVEQRVFSHLIREHKELHLLLWYSAMRKYLPPS